MAKFKVATPKIRIIPPEAAETVEETAVRDGTITKRAPSYIIPNGVDKNGIGWYGDETIQEEGKSRKSLTFHR